MKKTYEPETKSAIEQVVLSVYRLTLGQPRQEELFETIHKENWNMDELKKLYINLSPWNQPHHNGGAEHEDRNGRIPNLLLAKT